MGFLIFFWEILRFEVLWKLAFFLIHPLFSGMFSAYVSTSELSFNGGVVWKFLTPAGLAVFLPLCLGAAWR